jgi:hypothetical protein
MLPFTCRFSEYKPLLGFAEDASAFWRIKGFYEFQQFGAKAVDWYDKIPEYLASC